MVRHFFLIIILLTGTGCATGGSVQVDRGEEVLAKSEKVVPSFDRIPYDPIDPGKPAEFAFDEEATILEAEGQRCFAKGFVLPELKGAISVSISSFKAGTHRDPSIMYPEVRLLDKDYKVTRTLPHKEFVFRWLGYEEEGLNAVLFLNNRDQRETFLLITNRRMDEASLISSQDDSQGMVPVAVAFPGGFFMWFVPTGKSTPPMKMKASPTGKMRVEIKEYRPQKVK